MRDLKENTERLGNAVAVDVRGVEKKFGDFTALDQVTISIADSEFFTLLGSSGCGKTTLLRIIAGFDQASHGEVFVFGKAVNKLPPNLRPVTPSFKTMHCFRT